MPTVDAINIVRQKREVMPICASHGHLREQNASSDTQRAHRQRIKPKRKNKLVLVLWTGLTCTGVMGVTPSTKNFKHTQNKYLQLCSSRTSGNGTVQGGVIRVLGLPLATKQQANEATWQRQRSQTSKENVPRGFYFNGSEAHQSEAAVS